MAVAVEFEAIAETVGEPPIDVKRVGLIVALKHDVIDDDETSIVY